MPKKPLRCRLGLHAWTTRVAQGEAYTVCAACGKQPRGARGDKPPPTSGSMLTLRLISRGGESTQGERLK